MQFAVHEYSAGGASRLVVVVQSDIIETPGRVVAIPLASAEDFSGTFSRELFPVVTVDGARYRVLTPDLASVQEKRLGAAVGNLRDDETEIKNAINLLFWGI